MVDVGYPSKSWAIKWLRGSLISFLRGNIDKKILLGRMRKCYEEYSLSIADIEALIESLVVDPSLDFISPETRHRLLNELMEEFKSRVQFHSHRKRNPSSGA
ncbi:MAG: hypothetical protein QXM43_09965 [Desulfurococcaceae archaeon]